MAKVIQSDLKKNQILEGNIPIQKGDEKIVKLAKYLTISRYHLVCTKITGSLTPAANKFTARQLRQAF